MTGWLDRKVKRWTNADRALDWIVGVAAGACFVTLGTILPSVTP